MVISVSNLNVIAFVYRFVKVFSLLYNLGWMGASYLLSQLSEGGVMSYHWSEDEQNAIRGSSYSLSVQTKIRGKQLG